MASKLLILAAIAVTTKAGLLAPAPLTYSSPLTYATPVAKLEAPLAYSVPTVTKIATPVAEEYDPNPQYQYSYDVQDQLTGDNKNQFEQRNGDTVQGSYSLNDADGFRRIVEYTADPILGFNAVVRREPLEAQLVAKVATPVVAKVATPFISKVAVPLAAPNTKIAYSQPQLHYSQPAQLHYAHPAPLAYHAPAPITKLAAPITAPLGFGFNNQIVH